MKFTITTEKESKIEIDTDTVQEIEFLLFQ